MESHRKIGTATRLEHPAPIRSAIFDDSASGRAVLEALLQRHPALTVVTSKPVRSQANYEGTHLFFVDPKGDPEGAFSWLAQRPPDTEVIITTETFDFAAQAFETDTFAYLRKPIDPDRLNHAIRRLLRLDWAPVTTDSHADQIFVAFERGRRMVTFDEIVAIRAFGNYTQVLLAGGQTEIVMKPLLRWQETLPSSRFLRIHRATLVNINRIRELAAGGMRDSFALRLEGVADLFPVSRRLLHIVRRHLAHQRSFPGDRGPNGSSVVRHPTLPG